MIKSNFTLDALKNGASWVNFYKVFLPYMEHLSLHFAIYRDAQTVSAKICCIIAYLKTVWRCDSVSVIILNSIDLNDVNFSSFFSHFFENIQKKEGAEDIRLQSKFLDSLGNILDSWEQLRESEMFTHFRRTYIILLCSNLFSSLGLSFSKRGFSDIDAALAKKDVQFGSDGAILYGLRAFHFIATKGVAIYETGSLETLHNDVYDPKWTAMANWLIGNAEFYNAEHMANGIQDPEDKPFSNSLYSNRLDAAIVRGTEIGLLLGKKRRNSESHSNRLIKLMNCRSRIRAKDIARSERSTPYSILITGEPGIGKTSFTQLIFSVFGKCQFKDAPNKTILTTEAEYMYVHSPTSDFWDNFRSSMWCLLMDDIGLKSVGVSQGGGDPSVIEIIQIINTVPYIPNRAALEDKGKTPLLCQLVMATSNKIDFNASSYFSYPSASLRRFPFVVTLSVKEHLCKEGTLLLDSNKIDSDNDYYGDMPDFWHINVKEVKIDPSNPKNVVYHDILQTDSIEIYISWYLPTIRNHYIKIDNMRNSSDSVLNMRWCSDCNKQDCKCESKLTLQSDVVSDTTLESDDFIYNSSDASEEFSRTSSDAEEEEYTHYSKSAKDFWSDQFYRNPVSMVSYFLRFCHFDKLVQKGFLWQIAYEYMSQVELVAQSILDGNVDYKRFNMKKYLKEKKFAYKFSHFYITLIFIMSAIGIVRLILQIFNLCKKVEVNLNGGEASNLRVPQPHGNETPNVWYSKEVAPIPYDIPNSSRCEDNNSIRERISRNVINIIISSGGKRTFCSAIGLKEDYYVTVKHPFTFSESQLIQMDVTFHPKHTVSENTTFTLLNSDFTHDGDICIFKLRGSNPCANILKYLPQERFPWRGGADLLFRRPSGLQGRSQLYECSSINTVVQNVKIVGMQYTSSLALKDGSCGSAICIETPDKKSYFLTGMHCAGASKFETPWETISNRSDYSTGYCHSLYRNIIDPMLDRYSGEFGVLSSATRDLSSDSRQVVLHSSIHRKSPIRYLKSGVLSYYGSLNVPRAHTKSRVTSHLMRDYFLAHGYAQTAFKPELDSYKPWYAALDQSTRPGRKINPLHLKMAMEGYLADVYKGINRATISELVHPVPLEVAINGADGIAFCDGIPRSTSAGFPWLTTKKKFMEFVGPTEINTEPITFTSEIMNRVEDIRNMYHDGNRASPVFNCCVKDEAVSQKKLDSGAFRIFSASPIDFTILARQVFLGIIRLMQLNHATFEGCPGLIAQSPEWHNLYNDITRFGKDCIFDGDYSKFDKGMEPECILAAFEILYNICKRSGNYTHEQLLEIRGVATDITFALTNFNGDLIQFFGTNPSGHILTVIINCIVNSLYMRMAYIDLNPKSECFTFKDNVVLRTYGDDNIAGSRVKWFNHTSVSASLGKIGILYTMADKTTESVPFKNIRDCGFLKRSWLWNPELKQYLAVLDESSISKMLTTVVSSSTIAHEEQSFETVLSACREYFFYGREVYDQKREMFLKGIEQHNLEYLYGDKGYIAHMPHWEELANSYCRSARDPSLNIKSPFISEEDTNTNSIKSDIVLQAGVLQNKMQSNNNNDNVTHNTTASPSGQMEQSSANATCITQGTTKFFDADPGFTTKVQSQPDGTYGVGSSGVTDIKDFLARPVEVDSFTVAEGASGSRTLDPWFFFNTASIKRKLENYAYIRCKLNIKIVVNAAPIWWGNSIMTYRPLVDFSPTSISMGHETLTSASQMAHVYVNPTNSQGGCICVPFFYDKNWLDITDASAFENMGRLHHQFMSSNGLRCSTSPTSQVVEYKIFVWATDVELTQSTADIALQSGEWATGPVSGVASAIANATGKLHSIPYIGPYMKATQIASTAIGKIAHIFGFSRTPVIDNVSPMKNLPFGVMANCGTHELMDRLVVDPKQELCIDSRTVGLDGEDQMTISSIATRETFLVSCDWKEKLAHGSIIFNCAVGPMFWNTRIAGEIQPAAITFASYPFSFWRGDIVFRIVVVASKFHRGRLLVQWDPLMEGSAATDINVVASQIIDLATNRDMEFVVPYAAQTPFLNVSSDLTAGYGARIGAIAPIIQIPLKHKHNGSLTITVLNEATGITNTDQYLDVQVFVRGGDNFEVAAPRDIGKDISPVTSGITLQSGELPPEGSKEDFSPTAVESTVMIETTDCIEDKMYDVCFGEKIVSFRTLLKRYAYVRNAIFPTGQPNRVISRFSALQSRWPLPRGRCTDGIDTFNVTYDGNVANNCLFTYLQGAFVGMRGSARWKFNAIHRNTINDELSVARPRTALSKAGWYQDTGVITSVSPALAMETMIPDFEQCGYTITNQHTQCGMEVEAPHYSKLRFITSSPYATMLGNARSDTTEDAIQITLTCVEATSSYDGERQFWSQHFAVGDDFSFFYFLHTPIFFTYTINIT